VGAENMDKNFEILLQDTDLDPVQCGQAVWTEGTGAIVLFDGRVRNATQGKSVKELFFESYRPMAIKEMSKVAEQALANFDIIKIAIHHKLGSLKIGEIPVLIAVSSAHRKAAFEACEFAIDELKKTVPIWKKEYFEDGEIWVSATP
jgi:molybdopterin synthase catalytic subunit